MRAGQACVHACRLVITRKGTQALTACDLRVMGWERGNTEAGEGMTGLAPPSSSRGETEPEGAPSATAAAAAAGCAGDTSMLQAGHGHAGWAGKRVGRGNGVAGIPLETMLATRDGRAICSSCPFCWASCNSQRCTGRVGAGSGGVRRSSPGHRRRGRRSRRLGCRGHGLQPLGGAGGLHPRGRLACSRHSIQQSVCGQPSG